MRTNGAWSLSALIALSALGGGRAAGAEPPQPPARPDFVATLLRLGLSREAGWEARRLTTEGGPEAIAAQTAYDVGMALALDGEPEQAAPFLNDAAAAVEDPARSDEWQLAAGVVLLRARAYPHALHLFSRVEELGVDQQTRAFAGRLRCVAEVMALDATAARACAAALPAGAGAPAELGGLIDTLEIDPRHRAIWGGVLSAVLPGLGQATAGRPGDGALALLVNGGVGVGVAFLLADGAVAGAALLGLGLGLRYYLGNIEHGAAAWRAAAERHRGRAARQLIRIVAAPH
ncbi:MAG TPA: hypothetical protein VHH90_01465 [Polyangia bacterium]|nr:hypothetical protein [Polyangia bacterium]